MLTSLTKVGKDIMKALLQTKEVDFRILRTVAKPDELVLQDLVGQCWTNQTLCTDTVNSARVCPGIFHAFVKGSLSLHFLFLKKYKLKTV